MKKICKLKEMILLLFFLLAFSQVFGQDAGYSYKTIYSSDCMSIYVKCDYYWQDSEHTKIETIANIYVNNNCSKKIKVWWYIYYGGCTSSNSMSSGNPINGYDKIRFDMTWRNYNTGVDPSDLGYSNVKWQYVD